MKAHRQTVEMANPHDSDSYSDFATIDKQGQGQSEEGTYGERKCANLYDSPCAYSLSLLSIPLVILLCTILLLFTVCALTRRFRLRKIAIAHDLESRSTQVELQRQSSNTPAAVDGDGLPTYEQLAAKQRSDPSPQSCDCNEQQPPTYHQAVMVTPSSTS